MVMKKYLMTSVAVLAIVAAFTSCHKDFEMMSPKDFTQANYQAVFTNYVGGTIAANQDWGFGSSANQAITRGTYPEGISFRGKTDITEPTTPTFYTTIDQVKAAGVAYVGDIDYNNGWDNVTAAYLDANSNAIRSDRSQGRTYYVSGDVTYWNGFSNGDATLVVLENSTLHLGCASHNMKIYLAPGAKLDVRKTYKENVISYWPYQSEIVEQDWEGEYNFEKSNALLYLSAGSEVIGKSFKFFDGAKIKNMGGTITAENINVDKNTTLWNEGTVTVSNNLQGVNENAYIYNAANKTITASTINLINNSDLLVNDGIVTTTGAITTHNSGAEIVNNATMTCASYSQAAGGKIFNVGTMTMTGKTDLTNANSEWQNDGQWTCGSFDVDNYSVKNFNNCRLTVNGNFFLNRGTFVLNSEAGVVCDSFTWEDTSDFYLGGKSVLKVNGTLLTNNYNSGYGFRGVGNDYAVIQANEIAKGKGDVQFSMSYFGKLYIATDNHFAQGALDPMNAVPAQPYYYFENSVKFKFNGDNTTTIPSSECNPGYQGNGGDGNGGGSGGDNEVFNIRIIGEDLSASSGSDFDFNDIVIDLKYDDANAVVMLRAAGGTLKLRFGNGDDKVWEVHELFGVEQKVMVNTHAEVIPGAAHATKAPVRQELGYGISSAAEAKTKLKIEVFKNNEWCELTAETAQPAAKIAVDTDYQWLDERMSIKSVYPNFVSWVQNPDRNDKWWKTSNE